ncbi:MAG: hypothetical protein ACUVQ1_02355 [Candidatus Kapaibacteriales bacterium]
MKRIVTFFVLILMLTLSCSTPKIIREYPEGNFKKLKPNDTTNTIRDEVAPIQIPTNLTMQDPCNREQGRPSEQPFDGIITSQEFIRRAFPPSIYSEEAINYLTSNVETLTFLSASEGFAAFSHPPTNEFTRFYNLNMNGSIGGTDIFYFYPKQEKIYFEVLPPPLNSYFWDSHPFVTNDELGNILLVWASDRLDNLGGFSHPYKNEGNTDLYFAFKTPSQDFSEVEVENFNSVLEGINTKFSEASPFLFCKCYNPTLFFASNRNSKDSTFDIFYVQLEIDFSQKKIVAKSNIETLSSKDPPINTTADERFPFVAYPHITSTDQAVNLYFTSNRFMDSIVTEFKDKENKKLRKVFGNVGGYDLYTFELDKNLFKCVPPPPAPPPKLYVIAHLNEYYYDFSGNLIDSLIDISETLFLNNETISTKSIQEIALATNYKFERRSSKNGCDSCFSTTINFRSPERIIKDTTLEFTITTKCYRIPPRIVEFTLQKGLAFFVTGYWYPTTKENLFELWSRSASGCLRLSKFIDSTDFKPDSRYFYLAAAEENDKWLNEFFYPTLDSLLQLLDTCYSNQKILITVHGYTDPCPLRTIRDESGRIIEDSTLYSCDPDIFFNDIKIPTGIKMKQPELYRLDGKRFVPPFGAQQGNYLLAMLRAYYTKETLRRGFENYAQNRPKSKELFKRFVRFQIDAFGIYDDRPCSNLNQNIVGIELANKPYPPDLNEPCNLPHSRRAMIYVDVVLDTVIARGIYRGECGAITYGASLARKVEAKKEAKKPSDILPLKEEIEINLGTIQPYIPPQIEEEDQTCVGPCYRVLFGRANNTEEYIILKNLLNSLGFEIDGSSEGNLELISKSKFLMIEQAQKYLDEFNRAVGSLSVIVEINRIKARIIQI